MKHWQIKLIKRSEVVKFTTALLLCFLPFVFSACSELKKPKTETFYAISTPPAKQEFRWSNGKMPKSFDPALASAPPETDIVRAIYDGLTETETKSLKAIPAISYKWESADDYKTWTFTLRKDARWSNGKKVTANDFVSSWKRLVEMGDKVTHHELLKNIVGATLEKEESDEIKKKSENSTSEEKATVPEENKPEKLKGEITRLFAKETVNQANAPVEKTTDKKVKTKPSEKTKKIDRVKEFGVKAIGNYKLEISLIKPDKDFPKLVAHPIFRPVYANGKEFDDKELKADIVTNGAFRVFSIGRDGITLDRADYYFNKEKIKLERVRFVATENAESALEAYKKGEIDAVTNAEFEPLALKILTPFFDFKRTTHSALNFYEFNQRVEPFNDRRVRQALAISIDRKRLTEDEMEGATEPAFNFLPFEDGQGKANLAQENEKAQSLMSTAGFPDGEGFPVIKLVINRNNVQQRIAKSVAKMWKQNLNIDTEIIVQEFDELEISKEEGTFDIIRRGVVLPTSDETANMLAIFAPKRLPEAVNKEETNNNKTSINKDKVFNSSETNINTPPANNTNIGSNINSNAAGNTFVENELFINTGENEQIILTEEEAIIDVPAIPLYFPRSYSLVKPYVEGFEMNKLDAPSLKDVQINNYWQPKKTDGES